MKVINQLFGIIKRYVSLFTDKRRRFVNSDFKSAYICCVIDLKKRKKKAAATKSTGNIGSQQEIC